jgi:hypothetical protein
MTVNVTPTLQPHQAVPYYYDAQNRVIIKIRKILYKPAEQTDGASRYGTTYFIFVERVRGSTAVTRYVYLVISSTGNE